MKGQRVTVRASWDFGKYQGKVSAEDTVKVR